MHKRVPANENAGKKNALIDVRPSTVASVIPNDAPDDIPKVYGSARGFLRMLCKAHPPLERPAPTIIAARIRGALSFQSIVLYTFWSDGKNKALNRSLRFVVVDPRTKAARASAPRSIRNEKNIGLNGLFIFSVSGY